MPMKKQKWERNIIPKTITQVLKLGYSTKPDRSDWKEFGERVPSVPIYIEARDTSGPVVFSVFRGTDPEPILKEYTSKEAPYQHSHTPYMFLPGVYYLKANDKTVSFTVPA